MREHVHAPGCQQHSAQAAVGARNGGRRARSKSLNRFISRRCKLKAKQSGRASWTQRAAMHGGCAGMLCSCRRARRTTPGDLPLGMQGHHHLLDEKKRQTMQGRLPSTLQPRSARPCECCGAAAVACLHLHIRCPWPQPLDQSANVRATMKVSGGGRRGAGGGDSRALGPPTGRPPAQNALPGPMLIVSGGAACRGVREAHARQVPGVARVQGIPRSAHVHRLAGAVDTGARQGANQKGRRVDARWKEGRSRRPPAW